MVIIKTIYNETAIVEQQKTVIKNNMNRGKAILTNHPYRNVIIFLYALFAISLIIAYAVSTYNKLCSIPYILRKTAVAANIIGLIIFAGAIVPAVLIYICGQPWKYNRIDRDSMRAGMVNAIGEPAYILSITASPYENCDIMTFESKGIAPAMWIEKIPELQNAHNVNVVAVKEGCNRRTTELWVVPPVTDIGKTIEWDDGYIADNDAVIVLGRGYIGDVYVNLDITPHILIGGETGSGKSVLFKTVIWQHIKHDNKVYIADFKGGVDFSKGWHEHAEIITDEDTALKALDTIADELEKRKKLFFAYQVTNVAAYRENSGHMMKRIIFACDEVAELLDKTGADKEQKTIIADIEKKISLIARQGRAFGIHLLLATQRPDANILPGQIKNNMNIKICGRAEDILSRIILDNASAHEQIPKDSQGRFITNEGTVFQGFFFVD